MLYLSLALLAGLTGWLVFRRRYGFRGQDPRTYAGTQPAFDIRSHLNGPLDCEGVIYGPLGTVSSRFTARMQGDWNGATGTLAEHFCYASGGTQDRKWHLDVANDGSFTATADDIIGTGRGVMSGATVCMSYRLKLPQEAGGHVLDVTDWMYLMDNGVIMNRSEMRKFGLRVAELIATMRPAA
ncbi:MAG: DUF3833 domain-containing protein [Nioella sp.]